MDKSVYVAPQNRALLIATCQKILRLATGVILGAFVLVIVLTTFSTGPLVQQLGKVLYYLIVGSALISLATWVFRTRLERRVEGAIPPEGKDRG